MANASVFRNLIFSYYAATLIFIALDYLAGLNLRLTFLDDQPAWRFFYYLFCALCLFLVWRFPHWTAVIALTESTVNLAGLILDMGIRVITVTDVAIEGGEIVTPREIVNFVLSGGAAYVAMLVKAERVRRDTGIKDRF